MLEAIHHRRLLLTVWGRLFNPRTLIIWIRSVWKKAQTRDNHKYVRLKVVDPNWPQAWTLKRLKMLPVIHDRLVPQHDWSGNVKIKHDFAPSRPVLNFLTVLASNRGGYSTKMLAASEGTMSQRSEGFSAFWNALWVPFWSKTKVW